jgi:outer membrane biosynthesis protein TonB
MRATQRLLAFTAFAMITGAASAQEITGVGDALAQRGLRIVSVVAPEYPPALLHRGVEATLSLEARVNRDGSIDMSTLKIAGGDEAFAASVRDVARYWLFVPPIHAFTCASIAGDLAMQVWFEVADGKPKVSVSSPVQPSTAALAAKVDLQSGNEMVRRRSGTPVIYPEAAHRDRVEGDVTGVVRINNLGRVTGIEVRPGPYRVWFEPAIKRGVRSWTFEILPGFPKDRDYICAEFKWQFRLKDGMGL